MHVGVIGHREARLHGAKVMPGLDLRSGQGHYRTAVNAMEGDLLNTHWDVLQTVDE